MAELKLPTEVVKLPSKGLLYPKESPLSKGEIEMKYMTAKEEDILTNSNSNNLYNLPSGGVHIIH